MEGRLYIKSAMLWVWGAVSETKGNTRYMFNTNNEPNIKNDYHTKDIFSSIDHLGNSKLLVLYSARRQNFM